MVEEAVRSSLTIGDKIVVGWVIAILLFITIREYWDIYKMVRQYKKGEKSELQLLKDIAENIKLGNKNIPICTEGFSTTRKINEGIEELKMYGELYPDEFEGKIVRYSETLKVLKESSNKIKQMEEKEESVKELCKVFRLMYEDMLPKGLDGRVAEDLEKEREMINKIKKGV